MNSLLNDLWKHAVDIGELFPALIDAEMEIDQEFGDMLLWCYNNLKWPGFAIEYSSPEPRFWFIIDHNSDAIACYLLPWPGSELTNVKEITDSPRQAFEDVFSDWKNR